MRLLNPSTCLKIKNSLLFSLLAGNSEVETGSTTTAATTTHSGICRDFPGAAQVGAEWQYLVERAGLWKMSRTTPVRNPRTECLCHPVACIIAAIVARACSEHRDDALLLEDGLVLRASEGVAVDFGRVGRIFGLEEAVPNRVTHRLSLSCIFPFFLQVMRRWRL